MLEDIRNAVVNELSNSCQCQMTANSMDQEQLACFDASSLTKPESSVLFKRTVDF